MFEVSPQQLASVRGLGTGNALLWYGMDTRCKKQAPPVRDAFSEAFGVKNRLLRYGRDIRCQKQPSLVRDASSKARRTAPAAPNAFSKASRTADSTDCGQPTAARDAFSEVCRAKSSSCRTGRIFSARNGLRREEASKHKKRVLIKVYQDFLATLLSLIELYSD